MTSNHDPTIVTVLHNALEDIKDHFLKFSTFEGAQHFFGLFAQIPTTLLTLDFLRNSTCNM